MSEARPAKQRKKASAACLPCRARRTKCNLLAGQSVCNYCQRKNLQCVFQDDDERKKSASKARIRELDGRLQMLETMLKQQATALPATAAGQKPEGPCRPEEADATAVTVATAAASAAMLPPPSVSPRDRLPSTATVASVASVEHDLAESSAPTVRGLDVSGLDGPGGSPHNTHSSSYSTHSNANSIASANTSKPVVAYLVETVGNLNGAGRSADAYGDSIASSTATLSSASREQQRQTDRLLEDVPPDIDEYLISLFFQYGNSMLLIVDKEAFLRDKAHGGSRNYSGFLHVVLLAMGLRYSDHARADIARFLLPNRESTLHKGARYLVEYELQCRGGIPSIQGLLLLGDLEAACGRDNTGWMYGGMAIRLCFDVGLHQPPKTELKPWEWRNWRAALWACYIHDRYWSFYLGRPTSMKRSDIVASQLMHDRNTQEEQIFSALITLMDIFTTLTDNVEHANRAVDESSYVFMTNIHRKLNAWYSELPEVLQWNETNIASAPSSFFLLHQQYHSSLILLHRDLAEYSNTLLHKNPVRHHLALVSRAICFENAMKVAQIFADLRAHWDIRKVYFSAVQHAGTAATALINSLSLTKDAKERVKPLQNLRVLYIALQDMAPVYQPADRMSTALSNSFVIARWNRDEGGQKVAHPALLQRMVGSKWTVPPGGHMPATASASSAKRPRLDSATGSGGGGGSNSDGRQNSDGGGSGDGGGGDLEQCIGIPFPQLFDANNDTGQFPQTNLSIGSGEFATDDNQMDDSMNFMFTPELADTTWEPMLQLSPLQPRRANFLDTTSGFDQLFYSRSSNMM